MSILACASTPADRDGIALLMREALGIEDLAPTLEPGLLQWKYWGPHPFGEGSRGRILKDDGAIVAHGGIWPIQLNTATGVSSAFHLIDWAAKRNVPGAGMKVLRECGADMEAVFSVGGSAMTRKILPAFGFKPYNSLTTLHRPLRPVQAALEEAAPDWKLPARVARSSWRRFQPFRTAPRQWRASRVEPHQIPDALWPTASATAAVSVRSAALLAHMAACPGVRGSACILLEKAKGDAGAYVMLVQVRNQVRLVDYGPADLDEEACRALAVVAQGQARSLFPKATTFAAATSEPAMREALLWSGMRVYTDEAIKVLKLKPTVASIDRFRLTMLDWDALFL